ncbi:MAG: superoxide dismutase family protein [Anaerolineae bacterium]|jgi:Cu-Zn family superoxide dismutase|nr:superoxide dismutase family protein [Anaerolineae bacterium]
MNKRFAIVCLLLILMISSVWIALGQDSATPEATPDAQVTAMALLNDVDGNLIGTVVLFEQADKVIVSAGIELLPDHTGFLGFHIHAVGDCGDNGTGPFTAAGPHLNLTDSPHPDHAGDLPPLLVNRDGTAYFSVETDRFTLADLFDADGSAVIIHANADNFANIPERYGGPDEETLKAGDSGERIVCGVIEQGIMSGDPGTTEATPAG